MLDRIFDLNRINNAINSFSNEARKEYYNYLLNEFGVLFTYHSNRIEGTNKTLTFNDTKKIINNTYDFKSVIDKNKEREINETINHQNAFKYIFEIKDKELDIIRVIKSLHQIIGSNTIEGAGNYKERDNYLINSNGEENNFTLSKNIDNRMIELKNKYENHPLVVNFNVMQEEVGYLLKNLENKLKI